MTYLKRKIDETLRQWKADPKRKPLIVKGPRQIGKTESVHHFAEANYTSVIYINFVEELIKHTGEEPEKWLPYFWGEKPLSELNLNSNPGE